MKFTDILLGAQQWSNVEDEIRKWLYLIIIKSAMTLNGLSTYALLTLQQQQYNGKICSKWSLASYGELGQ